MSDEYALVSRGKLKLKSDDKDKKKKKKQGIKEGRVEKHPKEEFTEYAQPCDYKPKLTKAEASFKKMREQMVSLDLLFGTIWALKRQHSTIDRKFHRS